jgi:rubrerythrin
MKCSLCKQIGHNKRTCGVLNYIRDDWTYIHKITHWTRELVLGTLQISGNFFKYIPDEFKKDINIKVAAIRNNPNAVRFMNLENEQLPENAIRELLVNNGLLLRFMTYIIQDNYEFAKLAIENKGLAWFYISDTLKQNKDLLELAISKEPSIIQMLSQKKDKFERYKDTLTHLKFSKLGLQSGECNICLETNYLVSLQCHIAHTVCVNCIDKIPDQCPYCRAKKCKKEFKSCEVKIWS